MSNTPLSMTMRLTVLKHYARGLPQVDAANGNALRDSLNSIKSSGISGMAMPDGPWEK